MEHQSSAVALFLLRSIDLTGGVYTMFRQEVNNEMTIMHGYFRSSSN